MANKQTFLETFKKKFSLSRLFFVDLKLIVLSNLSNTFYSFFLYFSFLYFTVQNWKEFDYYTVDPKSVIQDGIWAGNYTDGSQIYVGAGYNSYINDIVPARVMTSGPIETGAYVCENSNEYLDLGESAAYLAHNESQVRLSLIYAFFLLILRNVFNLMM